jgi:membrane protease subunit HflC
MRFTARNIIIILAIFIGFLTFTGAFFIVNETKQSIVLQFGEPRQVISKPGLQFKIPFIQDAVFLDSRMLNLDPQPEEMILSDQKRIIVDSFARYRIVDPLKFFQTVRNEATFSDRFGRIINAAVRGVIAQYPLSSLLSQDRAKIMSSIQSQVTNEEGSFGVKIVDIRIGRTDLTEQVSNNVYQRMISERDKEANLLRAEGQELSKEIVASADRQQTVIVAEAQRTSSILRGEGDAAKNKILGDAYSLDEDFFDFFKNNAGL